MATHLPLPTPHHTNTHRQGKSSGAIHLIQRIEVEHEWRSFSKKNEFRPFEIGEHGARDRLTAEEAIQKKKPPHPSLITPLLFSSLIVFKRPHLLQVALAGVYHEPRLCRLASNSALYLGAVR
jgi:hypothetical protein